MSYIEEKKVNGTQYLSFVKKFSLMDRQFRINEHIGKNIVTTVLSCHGFDVMDLGVDVASGQFVKAIEENAIRIVGLSCLLTTAFDSMKQTIDEIQSAGLRENLSIMIGGAPVTQTVCDHVGADAFCTNANEAVEKAKRLIGGAK